MRKIIVIGSPGSGKSVLARTLGEMTGIPVHHLDALYWKPGWVPPPATDWERLQRSLVEGETWIIDGMYSRTLSIRLDACDTIVFLDFPTWLTTVRVVKRFLRYRGRERPDMAPGCAERLDWEFVRFVWTFRSRRRSQLIRRIRACPGKTLVILARPREVRGWLRRVKAGQDDESSPPGFP